MEEENKKYFIVVSDNADDIVPDAEHIVRNDEYCAELGVINEYDDFDAAAEAERDAAEVKVIVHSYWNDFWDGITGPRKTCNECKGSVPFIKEYEFDLKYCPHCGAIMDQEREVKV